MKTALLASLLCLVAGAAEPPKPAPAGPAKAYPLKTCLVSDNDLDSMGEQTSIVHDGRVLKFCCQPCVGKFQKNPAKYLAKLEGK